jgi:hypothetical protein
MPWEAKLAGYADEIDYVGVDGSFAIIKIYYKPRNSP